MEQHYKSGWVASPDQETQEVWTIPLDVNGGDFCADTSVVCLGNEVRLTLTGIRLEKLVGPDGIDTGVVVIDRSRVKENINGSPVLDSWVIYDGEDGEEVGIEIYTVDGRKVRIFLDRECRYTVQEIYEDSVRVEVKHVNSEDLGDAVLRAADMARIDLTLLNQ